MRYILTLLLLASFFTLPVLSETTSKNEENPLICENRNEIPHGQCICTYTCKKRETNEDGSPKCDEDEILDCYRVGLPDLEYACTCVKQINGDDDDYEDAYEAFCRIRKRRCALKGIWNAATCTCMPRDKKIDDIFEDVVPEPSNF